MNALLDTFCDLLDRELERQARALDLSRAQRDALARRDLAHLASVTERLEDAVRSCAEAEAERQALLPEIVAGLGLALEEQTLSGLIARVGPPWRHRMARFQREIRALVGDAREVMRDNRFVIRTSLERVNRVLDGVTAPGRGRTDYDARGVERRPRAAGPALLDQRS